MAGFHRKGEHNIDSKSRKVREATERGRGCSTVPSRVEIVKDGRRYLVGVLLSDTAAPVEGMLNCPESAFFHGNEGPMSVDLERSALDTTMVDLFVMQGSLLPAMSDSVEVTVRGHKGNFFVSYVCRNIVALN